MHPLTALAHHLHDRWIDDDNTLDHRHLTEETSRRGLDHLTRSQPGQHVTLYGRVTAITIPGGSGQSFTADIHDGTDTLTLTFPGTARVDSLTPGITLEMSGTLNLTPEGTFTIINPELTPDTSLGDHTPPEHAQPAPAAPGPVLRPKARPRPGGRGR